MRAHRVVSLGVGVCLLASAPAHAAVTCEYPNMLIVLDKSSSMIDNITPGLTKWAAARAAVNGVVNANGAGIHFGLMLFPDPNQCGPGGIKVNVGPNTAASISSYLASPPPSSGNYTPMSQSLDAAAAYAPLLSGPQRNFV